MNPNREGPQVNFELPPQPASPEADNQRQETGAEAPVSAPERAGSQPPQAALPVIPDIPAVDTPVISVPVQDDTAVALPYAHPADDVERIEPVWVEKAKQIIARTHDDPYMQKDEMSRVKAEYIQKRFNKQIKTDEAVT